MIHVSIIDKEIVKVSFTTFKTPKITLEGLKPESMIRLIRPGTSILDAVSLDTPELSDPKIFYFTANDLVNERITRFHNFNVDAVDVTVYNHQRLMISCDVTITNTSVTLHLPRVNIDGTWMILVEKM
jgi:hypothetical protein